MRLSRQVRFSAFFSAALLLLGVCGSLQAQDAPLLIESDETLEEHTSGWYRTEILVFARDISLAATEQWNPLPTLSYPNEYRYLIDPMLAERRRVDSGAYESTIGVNGRQSLLLPRRASLLEEVSRPDIDPAPVPATLLDPNSPTPLTEGELGLADPGSIDAALSGANTPNQNPMDPNSAAHAFDPNEPRETQLPRVIAALPYSLLPNDQLAFLPQARTLRRGGNDIVFHASWWGPIDDEESAIAIALDRSGDMDAEGWPELQGSLKLHRSRFLHVDLNLWLNTEGEYLREGWQIAAPPRAHSSLEVHTLGGEPINPWQEATPIDLVAPPMESDDGGSGITDIEPVMEVATSAVEGPDSAINAELQESRNAEEALVTYPFRHAIVHRQSRRMRSGEIHYLDHPLIGVIIQVSPIDDENLPLAAEDEQAFRDAHNIPSVSVILETDDEP